MKSEQSTCQDKIRLPRSTRFDPISVSDLGSSSAYHNKTILAEGARHRAAPFPAGRGWERGRGKFPVAWILNCGSKRGMAAGDPSGCVWLQGLQQHQELGEHFLHKSPRIPLSRALLSLGCHFEARKMGLFWITEVGDGPGRARGCSTACTQNIAILTQFFFNKMP